jgi:hypothetical protein
MQALSDEQQMERLERKVDDGFAEMRAEFKAVRVEMREEFKAVRAESREDFRTLIAVNLTMVVAMIFGFAGIVFAMLLHG